MRIGLVRAGSLIVLSAVAALACSTPREPALEIEKAELAITSANTSSAPTNAPLELQLAREKMSLAKAALRDDEYARAQRFAEQAQVDAQLAEAKAESETARASARELEQTTDVLRQEAERGAVRNP